MTAYATHFLIYEEHSPYRRELLCRGNSAADAQTQAVLHSRRTSRTVTVRRKDAGAPADTVISSFRAGKCVFRAEAPAAGVKP